MKHNQPRAGNPTADEVSLAGNKSTADLNNRTSDPTADKAFLAQNQPTEERDKETDSNPTEDDAFLADYQACDERTTCRTKRVRLCSLVWIMWALLLIPTFLLVAAIIYSMYQMFARRAELDTARDSLASTVATCVANILSIVISLATACTTCWQLLLTSCLDPGFVPIPSGDVITPPEGRVCRQCGAVRVPGKRVVHCSSCGRCVEDVDHHCFVMDNCIAKHTLRPFGWLQVWTAVQGAVDVVASAIAMMALLASSRDEAISQNATTWPYSKGQPFALGWWNWFLLAIAIVCGAAATWWMCESRMTKMTWVKCVLAGGLLLCIAVAMALNVSSSPSIPISGSLLLVVMAVRTTQYIVQLPESKIWWSKLKRVSHPRGDMTS